MNSLDTDTRGRPIMARLKDNRTYQPNDEFKWAKVRIRNTKNLDCSKEDLLRAITLEMETEFHALNYTKEDNSIFFWVQGRDLADAFIAVSKRIKLPNGFLLDFHVLNADFPSCSNIEEPIVIDCFQQLLNNRFNMETKALDLSEFDRQQIFRAKGFYLPLKALVVLEALAKIIKESGVTVKALSLKGNAINDLENIGRVFADIGANVELLDLRNNLLESIQDFKKISKWPLKILNLENNRGKELKYDTENLTKQLRQMFPKLQKLDDKDMPKAIGFELEQEEAKTKPLPKSIRMSDAGNPQIFDMIKQFLEHYYNFYDTDKQKILPAYLENAIYSQSAIYNKAINAQQNNVRVYTEKMSSRNLRYRIPPSDEPPAIKEEPLNIVAYLNTLPKTEHDHTSLTIDLGFVSPSFIHFVVTGVFREVQSSTSDKPIYRSFSRSFVTVPVGSGLRIINDQMTITNCTDRQVAKSFKTPVPATTNTLTQEQQREILILFMQQTNLVEEFALDALNNANWSLVEAGNLFQQHKDKIPPQGFRT